MQAISVSVEGNGSQENNHLRAVFYSEPTLQRGFPARKTRRLNPRLFS
jgi:hypothetical protein